MKSMQQLVLLFSGVLFVVLVLLTSQTRAAGPDCQELIQNKCASCHFVKYICPKVEAGKGSLSWRGTVNAMIKEGLTATVQEQDRLVNCLAEPDEKVKAFCPSTEQKP